MARRSKGERVLGPYPARKQWRIVVVGDEGQRDSRFYPTEDEAKEVMRAIRKEFGREDDRTVQKALDEYERYMREEKENKPRSVSTTVYRLKVFFPDGDVLLGDLAPQKCSSLYTDLSTRKTRLGKPFSVDFRRNALAEAKTFLGWCSAKKRWIAKNPLGGVEGVGKRRHGKPQLHIDEARRWLTEAIRFAKRGEGGAVAAMVALLMGMRATEIVERVARDLDDGGRLLWIPCSKTEAGRRRLQVPAVLQPFLLSLARGRGPEEKLFGHHWRDWVRKWVKRICKVAGVRSVTAHGMRGLHSSLAFESGITGHVVASSLGHDSERTTKQSYAKPEAVAGGKQRRVIALLEGERIAS